MTWPWSGRSRPCSVDSIHLISFSFYWPVQTKPLAVSKHILHFKPAHGFKWQLRFTGSSITMKPPRTGTTPLALQSAKRSGGHDLFVSARSQVDRVRLADAAWPDQASIRQADNIYTRNLQVMKGLNFRLQRLRVPSKEYLPFCPPLLFLSTPPLPLGITISPLWGRRWQTEIVTRRLIHICWKGSLIPPQSPNISYHLDPCQARLLCQLSGFKEHWSCSQSSILTVAAAICSDQFGWLMLGFSLWVSRSLVFHWAPHHYEAVMSNGAA